MSARQLIAIAALLLTFGLRFHLSTELGTQADEGVYVTAAKQIVEGDLLYQDLFWNHTPGQALLLALVFRLTGAHVLVGRLLPLSSAMITVAALILAGRWLLAESNSGENDRKKLLEPGILAGLLFALAPLAIFWSRFAMLENLETTFAVLSMAFAIRGVRTGARRAWFLAGLMAGLALLFKISALVVLGTLFLFLFVWWLVEKDKKKIGAGLLYLGGLLLALLPIALLILFQGSGADFLHFISGADRLEPLVGLPEKIVSFLDWAIRRPFVPLTLLGFLMAFRLRQPAIWLLSLWVAMEVAALFLPLNLDIGWGGFSHYFLPSVASLCLLAGLSLDWSWQQFNTKKGYVLGAIGIALLLALVTLPGFVTDLNYVSRETTYPSASFEQEEVIGRALRQATPEGSPILVFGNSVFYLLADRRPANPFYQYPGYLPTSRLAAESDEALVGALQNPDTAAVLLTPLKANQLTEVIQNALVENWEPAITFPYDYQGEATLFLPKSTGVESTDELARFKANEAEIILHSLAPQPLLSSSFLVDLVWSTSAPVDKPYTVFVHIVGPDGSLVTQHDGMPVVNTRPTTSWEPGELVSDRHWLELPPNSPDGDYTIMVGLYLLETGERLSLLGGDETAVSVPFKMP